jgi:hypothetical protein
MDNASLFMMLYNLVKTDKKTRNEIVKKTEQQMVKTT